MNNSITRQFKPRAKIDFITIGLPVSLKDQRAAFALKRAVDGRINAPNRWRGIQDDRLTIHDPTVSDLQYLVDHHPDTKVLAIEVAVDFFPKNGSNDAAQLIELHNWLKSRLFPQRHDSMREVGRRKYFDLRDGRITLDTLATSSGAQTIYWQNPSGYEQVRLYVKTHDNKQPLQRHCVRLEATLAAGGCQNALVSRVSMLPDFGDRMRSYLSRFLYVAAGIKPKIKRSRATLPESITKAAHAANKESEKVKRAWNSYGASWAAKHDYQVISDVEANRMIGGALKTLRDELSRLVAPQKRAEYPDYDTLKTP